MDKPLVTIVTPSYNQGRFIRATIESVLTQNYSNIEYIIVDGGSTDNTLSILQEYKDRITIISEKDEGQSDAINKGFRRARGSIVAWLNSDDVYEPGAVQSAVDLFEVYKDIAMIYGEGYIIDENGQKLKRFENTIDYNLWMLLYVWDYIMQPTTFFRKKALEEVGYLDKSLNWVMDWDLWIKFGLRYDIKYCNQFLACSREYGETKTSQGDWKRVQEIGSLFKKYTSKKKAPGYDIFYYVEKSKHSRFKKMQDRYQEKAVSILKKLPIPDCNEYCGEVTKFAFRNNEKRKVIHITNESDEKLELVILLDGTVYKRIELMPKSPLNIEMELSEERDYHIVSVEIKNNRRIYQDRKIKIRLIRHS